MSNPMLTGKGAIFAQRYGAPNTPEYLGCHDITAFDIPKGDVTLVRCPDASATGKFKVVQSYTGVPGTPTFTLTTLLSGAADYLEDWPCIGNILINKQDCGRRDVASNWIRRFIMYHAHLTDESGDMLVARDQADENITTLTFPFSPEEILKVFQVSAGTLGIPAALAQITGVTVCNTPSCAGLCGNAMEACTVVWVATKHITGSALDKGDVFYTLDGGATWSAAAAQPFIVAMDICAITCFAIDNTTTRIMVMNGTTQAGQGPEIAYTDDDGATWTTVEIISTHGLFGEGPQALFALDRFHIWAVTSGGHFAFSADGGDTWTEQAVGLTAANLFAVEFANASVGYAIGATGVLAKTSDGGLTWGLVSTVPAAYSAITLQSLEVLDELSVWIGTANGHLLFTPDAGVTWYDELPAGATKILALAFSHPMVGWAFDDTNIGWRTTDGGATWDSISVPSAMTKPSQFAPCDLNSGILVGGNTGTGVVVKYTQV
jgi:photosystem II stability/assembly factor-like uncharacterized protein